MHFNRRAQLLPAVFSMLCLVIACGDETSDRASPDRISPDRGEMAVPVPAGRGAEQAEFLTQLARKNAPTVEHERLEWLVGDWEMSGEWIPMADKPPLPVTGRSENRWILFGHAVESDGWSAEGEHTSKVLYGFDSQTDEYFAFSLNALGNHYTLERGVWDDAASTLELKGVELNPYTGEKIPYARKIVLDSEDQHTVIMSFPDGQGGSRSDMVLRFERMK
jgi:hypothetical protein